MLRHCLLAGSALACLALPTPVFAQASASNGDIVVTATRSARALSDVPASVSVVMLGPNAISSAAAPSTPAEDLMSKADLNARGDALIDHGQTARVEAMNLPQDLYRRSGPNKFVEVDKAEDMIRHGQALKARAATMP